MDIILMMRIMSYIIAAMFTLAVTLVQADNCYQCSHSIIHEIKTSMEEVCLESEVYCTMGCRVTRTFDAHQKKATIHRGCATSSDCQKYFSIKGKSLNLSICCSGDYCNKQKYELMILISLVIIFLSILLQFVYNVFFRLLYFVLFLIISLTIICLALYYFF